MARPEHTNTPDMHTTQHTNNTRAQSEREKKWKIFFWFEKKKKKKNHTEKMYKFDIEKKFHPRTHSTTLKIYSQLFFSLRLQTQRDVRRFLFWLEKADTRVDLLVALSGV